MRVLKPHSVCKKNSRRVFKHLSLLNNLDDNLKKINEISKSSQSNIKILAVASSKTRKNEEPNESKKTKII